MTYDCLMVYLVLDPSPALIHKPYYENCQLLIINITYYSLETLGNQSW